VLNSKLCFSLVFTKKKQKKTSTWLNIDTNSVRYFDTMDVRRQNSTFSIKWLQSYEVKLLHPLEANFLLNMVCFLKLIWCPFAPNIFKFRL